MPKYSLTCGSCGHKITGDTQEEVLNKTREHEKQMHDREINEQETRQKIEMVNE